MRVITMGSSGAVGSNVLATLQAMPQVSTITALVRKTLQDGAPDKLTQHIVDVLLPASYAQHVKNHDAAICTLGVGQPTKTPRDEFRAIDFDAVLAFAAACRAAGIKHFELLGSVAANPKSGNFYLKSKGELREAITALGFQRFSIFQPSMLITRTNRYDATQGLMLATWPMLSHLLIGGLDKYRSITVENLGRAMAHNLTRNILGTEQRTEILHWREIQPLIAN
jgi:uncharacterized protein YbjT (DUF2867 family)